MTNFWKLLKYELKLCHRSYHLVRHSAYIMLLSSIILSMMLSEGIRDGLKMLLVIFGSVISAVTMPSYLIKAEMQDGSFENLLSRIPPYIILLAKYGGMTLSVGLGILCTLPLIAIFYSLAFMQILYLLITIFLVLAHVISIMLLGNIIHAFFRHNTNLILALVIPLIIPSMIIANMAINTLNVDFIFILMGVDMIFIPVILVLSNYLLSHLYEF